MGPLKNPKADQNTLTERDKKRFIFQKLTPLLHLLKLHCMNTICRRGY